MASVHNSEPDGPNQSQAAKRYGSVVNNCFVLSIYSYIYTQAHSKTHIPFVSLQVTNQTNESNSLGQLDLPCDAGRATA